MQQLEKRRLPRLAHAKRSLKITAAPEEQTEDTATTTTIAQPINNESKIAETKDKLGKEIEKRGETAKPNGVFEKDAEE